LVADLVHAKSDRRSELRDRVRALGIKAVRALAEHLEDEDEFARWEAINLLGELAVESTLDVVVGFALRETEVHARWRAFWAVTRFDPGKTVPTLVRALRDKDPRRWNAALILSMLRRSEAVPVLREGLRSPDPWTRYEAVSAFRSLPVPGTESDLDRFLAADQPVALRQETVLALGALGSARAVKLLVSALGDPDPQVRWRASMALTRTHAAAALPALRRHLKREPAPSVRDQLAADIGFLSARMG
jgi:HEAT repeat protein